MWFSAGGSPNTGRPQTAALLTIALAASLHAVTAEVVGNVLSLGQAKETTSVTSDQLLSKRGEFDNLVESWKKKNSHLVHGLSEDTVNKLWQRLLESDSVNRHNHTAWRTETHLDRPTQPSRKPATASSSRLAKAREIVTQAVEHVNQRNAYLSKIPAGNWYTLGKTSASKRKREDAAPPWVLTDEIRDAAALLAEDDAGEMDKVGTLYREYNIVYKESPDGEIKYKSQKHGGIQARAGTYWLADFSERYPSSDLPILVDYVVNMEH